MFIFSETDDLVHVLGCSKASSLKLITFGLVTLARGFHLCLQAFSSPICVQARVYISRKFSPTLDCSKCRAVSTSTPLLYHSSFSGVCTLLEYLFFWPHLIFLPYIWTQISEFSPPHILAHYFSLNAFDIWCQCMKQRHKRRKKT